MAGVCKALTCMADFFVPVRFPSLGRFNCSRDKYYAKSCAVKVIRSVRSMELGIYDIYGIFDDSGKRKWGKGKKTENEYKTGICPNDRYRFPTN